MSRRSVRGALVAVIGENVASLVKRDRFDDLVEVIESTGYLPNREMTTKQLARAIIVLLPIIDRKTLECTAYISVFRRHYSPSSRRTRSYEHADQLGDRALADAGVDVDAWNARIRGDGERVMQQAPRAS